MEKRNVILKGDWQCYQEPDLGGGDLSMVFKAHTDSAQGLHCGNGYQCLGATKKDCGCLIV